MSLRERLLDPNEIFTQQEIYDLFELLAGDYGFHRSPQLPQVGTVETGSLTVPGFEDLGVIIVRPRTVQDSMITIPGLVDQTLGSNFNPSPSSNFNAGVIAIAKTVIVSPPGFVDRILADTSDRYFSRKIGEEVKNFFIAFYGEYERWSNARNEAIAKKNSGLTTGSASASMSATGGTSSPLPPTG